MIAIAMYIMLGVFVTLLLTLFVLPLIWRRAVRLTEKRMMAEMPISYSELQAEKDMQRAEQAIELRRLEVTADTRLEELANQSLKVDRLKSKIEDHKSEIADRKADIAALKDDLSAQEQETTKTAASLAATIDNLDGAKQAIADLETAKSELEEQLLHLETDYSEQKIELVAQSTRIENYKEELSELNSQYNTEARNRAEAEGLLSQKSSELDRNKERLEMQQSKLDTLQSEIADMDASITNLNLQLERNKTHKSNANSDIEQKLADAETRRVEAEAKIASLTLQATHGMNAENAKELSALVDNWQKEKTRLEDRLADALAQSERLNAELTEYKEKAAQPDSDAPLSPKELMLRNEIKNIAAQITGFTAQSEGDESVIHSLVGDDENGKPTTNTTTMDGVSDPNAEFIAPKTEAPEGSSDPWNEVFSLADRIRKMTNHSEDKKANP